MGLLVAAAGFTVVQWTSFRSNVAVLPVPASGGDYRARTAPGNDAGGRGELQQFLEKVPVSVPACRDGGAATKPHLRPKSMRIANAEGKVDVRPGGV